MSGAGAVRVLVNAAGAVSGGGRVATLAIIDELLDGGTRGLRWDLDVPGAVVTRYGQRPAAGVCLRGSTERGAAARVLLEQVVLPFRYRVGGYDVLISAGNFAPLAVRRGSLVMARNALHFTRADATGWRGVRPAFETMLARASVRRAEVALAATNAMADLVETRVRRRPLVIPFGPGLVRTVAPGPPACTVFLHRTTWGPHKRFGDVLLAAGALARTHEGRFLVRSACDPHTPFARSYRESARERALLEDPAIAAHVQLGSFEAHDGDAVVGDAVIMPSTTESFCFPLAEAVALGLPVVAADSAFARELCGYAARYVAPGSPDGLAAGMREVIETGSLVRAGPEPPLTLSWRLYVDRLAALCSLLASTSGVSRPAGRRKPSDTTVAE